MSNQNINIKHKQFCEKCSFYNNIQCKENNPIYCHILYKIKTEDILCSNCILFLSCSKRCKQYNITLIQFIKKAF